MLVIRQKMIYRTDIQANPNVLYVFGDNLDREGFGGQAKEMRGEPNSFGLATKRRITHGDSRDYFHDHEPDVIGILHNEFDRLEKTLAEGKTKCPVVTGTEVMFPAWDAVIVPADGLGTGLSKLPELAPLALEYINNRLEELKHL